MKPCYLLPVLSLFLFSGSFAQNQPQVAAPKEEKSEPTAKKPPLFGITFSGYVNTNIFFDSRQTVIARDGDWVYYPDIIKPDAEGKDINAKGTYNILSIETRLTGTIAGPDLFNARTSGLIEGEFYGNANANINSFRLRHAYVKLNWTKTELLVGQYWHPMFVAACYPEVVSFNTGAPFLVFSRNPQVRLTQQIANLKLILTALSQVDATSNGPDGPSTKYLRNSILPELDFQVQYGIKHDDKKTEFLIGASVDFFMLTPRLNTEVVLKPAYDTVVNNRVQHHDAVVADYRTDAKSTAFSANFFTKVKLPGVTLKLGAVYGNDCYAFNMIGGYAVKSMVDPIRGIVDYTPVNTGSCWLDFKGNGARWQPGIFGGFSKNLGAGTPVSGPYYTRGPNIDYLYRISPRLTLLVKKLKISGELEYTVAAYGTTNSHGGVSDSREVGNLRILIGVYYFF